MSILLCAPLYCADFKCVDFNKCRESLRESAGTLLYFYCAAARLLLRGGAATTSRWRGAYGFNFFDSNVFWMRDSPRNERSLEMEMNVSANVSVGVNVNINACVNVNVGVQAKREANCAVVSARRFARRCERRRCVRGVVRDSGR